MGKKGRVVNWTKRMRVHNVTERIVKGLLWDNGKGGFTHNSLSMHVNITTHPALPTPLLSTTSCPTHTANTSHSLQNGTRCRIV